MKIPLESAPQSKSRNVNRFVRHALAVRALKRALETEMGLMGTAQGRCRGSQLAEAERIIQGTHEA